MSASHHTRVARSQAARKLQAIEHKISYRLLPATKEVEISLIVNEKWGPIASEVLSFMDQMVRSVDRSIRLGFRDLRVEEMLAETELKYSQIRQQYRELRDAGVQHRPAVYDLVSDRSLPFHGLWSYADYNWCVRPRPGRPVIPTLKKVRAQQP